MLPRFSHVCDVSQGFLTVSNNVQAMPNMMFLQRLLHEQDVSGVIFQQKYHTDALRGASIQARPFKSV